METTAVTTIRVTEKAAAKIRQLLSKEGVPETTGGLRVGVQGGGCSGLTYAMKLDTQARDRDKVFEENGARVFVDPKSFLFLANTTLDYQETLIRQTISVGESADPREAAAAASSSHSARFAKPTARNAMNAAKPPPQIFLLNAGACGAATLPACISARRAEKIQPLAPGMDYFAVFRICP